MEQVLLGRSLPNLKIAVDNSDSVPEDKENAMDVEDEAATPNTCSGADEHFAADDQEVTIRRLFTPKVERKYDNKSKSFILGLDLSSKEMMKKLEERANRFGVEGWPKRGITEADVNALYKSLDIDEKCLTSSGGSRGIRLEAIHLRGVNDMSTEDIFEYFKDYGPASVEWINDCSCNVVWLDKTGTAHALLGLSRPIVVHKKKTSGACKDNPESLTETELPEGGEEVVIMSDEDDIDDEENEQPVPEKPEADDKGSPESEPKDADVLQPVPNVDDKEAAKEVEVLEMEVPVPPGHWRLGVPHSRAKALLLRFATRLDKKMPGAEKHSHYYQKYGNPNYGGMKGLISTSKKRRLRQSKQQDFNVLLSNADVVRPTPKPPRHDSDSDEDMRRRDKRPRMRMYADDEEEKQKKKRLKTAFKAPSIHRRLGHIPERQRRDTGLSEDDSDPEYAGSRVQLQRNTFRTVERSSGRRHSVWQRLSERRSSSWESGGDEELNSENSDNGDSFTVQRVTQKTDLRRKLDEGQKQNALRSVASAGGDLRGKLDQLRKDKEIQKHRSPLLIQVTNVDSS